MSLLLRIRPALSVLTALLLLSGCVVAQAPSTSDAPAPSVLPPAAAPAVVTEGPESGLTPELFYRLMVADVAAQRGESVAAAEEFLKIAAETRSASIARRATEVALGARAYPLASKGAALWLELEPGSERAQRISTALQASTGSLEDVREHLRRMIADEAHGGAATPEAFLQLNRLLAGQQDRLAVFRLVAELAEPYPDLPEAHLAVAAAGFSAGTSDPGVVARTDAAVDRALELRPGWDRAALLKAQILGRRSPDQAVEWLRTFTQAHPGARSVRTAFAQYLVEQRRYSEARAEFQRLWEEEPSALEMRYAVAVVSLQMRDYPAAEQHFQALKQAGYGEPGVVQMNLAQVAEDTRRYDEALARYRAVERGDRWWPAQLRIAVVLGKLEKVDEATAHLSSLEPDDDARAVQIEQTHAQVLREAGRNDEAFQVLSAALQSHPDNQDLLYDVAMAAEKIDRLDEAERNLRRLLELAPDSAHALNALGYTLVDRTDRTQEGFELIEKAHRLSPNDPFILDSLGWAYFRLGKLDESEKHLRRALAERPDPEIAAHLGEVLWAKGQHDQAREIWATQLKDTPDHPVLLETMRRLQR